VNSKRLGGDMIITIDGPTASGKSFVARELASRLGFYYLYTGLLYRAIAYILISEKNREIIKGVSFTNQELSFIKDLSYIYKGGEPHVLYKNIDISKNLYDMELAQKASIVSESSLVRTLLLSVLREISRRYNIIADGRDCGSVVFPNAQHKFFLTADVGIRAKRASSDTRRFQGAQSLESITQEITKRDHRDQTRAVAPLVVPDGAVVVDSTELTRRETVQLFLLHISHKTLQNL